MFVTTHSTEFVDSVSFQNAYLISRDEKYKTVSQVISAADGPMLLPAELGLRLSTVFMFDRLVFVEGPSDEAVLRALAKTLRLDFTKSNVGFVHMCGFATLLISQHMGRSICFHAARSTYGLFRIETSAMTKK